ncbi:PREDICTED: small G protein signaling modulator 1 isoform X2 [Tarenaya hassleriana]|uniref:small G protein signaling modulator 1 isoform X2 n=1 Tax=Tarenaya hassleriana TaxID=28532 RepID=UPI00053C4BE2|nr:PREDICTED: small G protein signaling modulator 1 isoform X2 [Tarenaya hassleriana]
MFSGGEDNNKWTCGKAGVINLQKVGSLVRDMSEPCLSQTRIKVVITVGKMLKPEKWQATFDSDGKVSGFQKVLKLIILGGIDPSIRAEVWEFLLGCYALSSTSEYRRQLRVARRERYNELLKQCQVMHSSVGTGSLAYVVGSKVMDMRKSYRNEVAKDATAESRETCVDGDDNTENHGDCNNNCADTSHAHRRGSSSESVDLVSGRESPDSPAYDASSFVPASSPGGFASSDPYVADGFFDFPPLPVIDLFGRSSLDEKGFAIPDGEASQQSKTGFEDGGMHSFLIDNNIDLVIEPQESTSKNVTTSISSEIEVVHPDSVEPSSHSGYAAEIVDSLTMSDVPEVPSAKGSPSSVGPSSRSGCTAEIVDGLRISDAPDVPSAKGPLSGGGPVAGDRVSEWLWTLHQIVVDVVRTDSHLEFYEDPRNLGRMSDILAVYAWVDPATGYCQGMSDLVSPFVVLFEDNADAFWCFEMLIRRTRANFQMEGPTGVMKQLRSLWQILQLTDKEIFSHLSRIGAESLHFAFRMLLVLFRRELPFNEALRMWEMMWAADFDESIAGTLENDCLEPLVVQLPRQPGEEVVDENIDDRNCNSTKTEPTPKSGPNSKSGPLLKSSLLSKSGLLPKSGPLPKTSAVSDDAVMKSASAYNFCGLTRSLWSRNERTNVASVVSSFRKGDDELPVFCVAAILIMNRHKIMKETRSIDDMIKIFNDKLLVIRVRRCIRTAIKLRKKYMYKLTKTKSQNQSQNPNQDQIQNETEIENQIQEEIQGLDENQSGRPSVQHSPCHSEW